MEFILKTDNPPASAVKLTRTLLTSQILVTCVYYVTSKTYMVITPYFGIHLDDETEVLFPRLQNLQNLIGYL